MGMSSIDPTTTKYVITAKLQADGIIEKPDVVGAIFGQTEGLLGEEMDLRELQKSGRMGRIEVQVTSNRGRSTGIVTLPSSLDKVETAILAASLETIDRIGPCKATLRVDQVEDVRVQKKTQVIDRAKEILSTINDGGKESGLDIVDEVRQTVQVSEITSFGPDRLPAGPNVASSDAIIIVEGRSDVLALLRSGIKNAIAVEGTNVPDSVKKLADDKVVTVFVDGDRGGDLILRELFQVADIDFVAMAPRNREVEELSSKQIMKALKSKVPAEAYRDQHGISASGGTGGGSGSGGASGPQGGPGGDSGNSRGGRNQRGREGSRGRGRDGRPERPDDRPRDRGSGPGAEEHDDAPAATYEQHAPQVESPQVTPATSPAPVYGGGNYGTPEPVRTTDPLAATDPTAAGGTGGEQPRARSRLFGLLGDRGRARPAAPTGAGRELTPAQRAHLERLEKLSGSFKAQLLTDAGDVLAEVAVRDLADSLKEPPQGCTTVVFDGVITQRLLDIAAEKGVARLVGVKVGQITKQPPAIEILTKNETA